MLTLQIRWKDGAARNYVDHLPCSWFDADGFHPEMTHLIAEPSGGFRVAKCTVKTRDKECVLDYTKFDEFNRERIDIGVLRLVFSSPDRSGIPEVLKRSEKAKDFSRSNVVATRSNFSPPEFSILPIAIPRYKGSQPFVKMRADPIPQIEDLKRSNQRNQNPRQRWFERQLREIAKEIHSTTIPWRFQTSHGELLQLDQGAVGHAIANGFIKRPPRSARLNSIEITILEPAIVSDRDATAIDGARAEVLRLQGMASRRPQQFHFSKMIRSLYQNKCAVTGCEIDKALEAAHIRTIDSKDDNLPENGILLRADIHALLDAGLITFAVDGLRLTPSSKLDDPYYRNICERKIFRPTSGAPSAENIQHHRMKYGFDPPVRSDQ